MKEYMKLIPNTWLGTYDCGWGNGYVILPINHPFHGAPYDVINNFVSVHGGLTYSNRADDGHAGWCVGFDTAHLADTKERWPREAVLAETERLMEQLISLGRKYTAEEVEAMVSDYYYDNDDEGPEIDSAGFTEEDR
jgi:hypothetical protein